MTDEVFDSKLNKVEKTGWTAIIEVCHNFLGNTKADSHRKVIRDHLSAYKTLECIMSLKIHFMDSHVDYCPENLCAV